MQATVKDRELVEITSSAIPFKYTPIPVDKTPKALNLEYYFRS